MTASDRLPSKHPKLNFSKVLEEKELNSNMACHLSLRLWSDCSSLVSLSASAQGVVQVTKVRSYGVCNFKVVVLDTLAVKENARWHCSTETVSASHHEVERSWMDFSAEFAPLSHHSLKADSLSQQVWFLDNKQSCSETFSAAETGFVPHALRSWP